VNGLKHGNRSADAEIERKMAKGVRASARAMAKIFGKTSKGKLSPAAGGALLSEIQEVIAIAGATQRAAIASRTARLQRKKELAK
jgi:hypothetical protein